MVSPGSKYTDSGWLYHLKSRNLLGVVLAAAVLAMMILLVTYWRRKTLFACLRNRHRDKKSGSSPGSLAKSSSLLTYNFASNPNYYAQAPDNLPLQTLAVQFIDKEQITFVGELGEGCFGKVYKGECGPRCPENLLANENGGSTPRVSTTVAVKVLKESASREAEADFLREVEIMSAFRHENILSLIGIVGTEPGGTPWMVFEYMPYGDLAEVLRSCNKQFYANDPPVKSLGKEDLLNMSVQIASGMEYLSSQHFIHRDLACRNCLVGENLTVKISDFGMSRDVYTCDYYKVGGTRMLPVRWMAPESIMYGKFTLESDVWSFGVVLWEIYSFGKQPYYGNSNEHVMKLIPPGNILESPRHLPCPSL
ncbi:tyrosine-protein kinase transmembrane receptor Ror-like [Macrobrachium nipponense]|uniref:tyrosine-protein kinase transmembrane receptor Ror-like n=1 Tax=Macrobrachium nipponense TaxID=159736 RepID=UPI0030C894FC